MITPRTLRFLNPKITRLTWNIIFQFFIFLVPCEFSKRTPLKTNMSKPRCIPYWNGHLFRGHVTPPKTNMEPENIPLQKEKHLQTTNFWGSMLVFGGVVFREGTMFFGKSSSLWSSKIPTKMFRTEARTSETPWFFETSKRRRWVFLFRRCWKSQRGMLEKSDGWVSMLMLLYHIFYTIFYHTDCFFL